jgi:hypothetical protein
MKNKQRVKFNKKFIPWIIFIAIFLSIYVSFNQVEYKNIEFPGWTDANGSWSRDDEEWLMRGYDVSRVLNKRRDIKIISKYYIDDVLCYPWIRARDQSTTYSKNPYRVNITAYSLPGKYTSFTVKNIKLRSSNGKEYKSDFANKKLPITVEFKNESSTGDGKLDIGYYNTEDLFYFKKELIIIELTLEINGLDESKIGTVVCELKPIVSNSLPLIIAYFLGA